MDWTVEYVQKNQTRTFSHSVVMKNLEYGWAADEGYEQQQVEDEQKKD